MSEVKGQDHRGQTKFGHKFWSVPDRNSSLNSQMATNWCTKLEMAQERRPIIVFTSSIQFLGHKSPQIDELVPIVSFSQWQLQSEFMDGYEMTHIASRGM